MFLGMRVFNDLPTFSPATLKNPEIDALCKPFSDLDIVEVLLRSGQSSVEIDVTEETRDRVNLRISEISQIEREQWGTEVRKMMQGLLRDVIRNTDSTSDTAEDRVMRRRKALFESLKKELEAKLYQYLDNQERGGLEYVISLVEQIKDKI